MERPKVTDEPKQREITGEVMYLADMRRLNEVPHDYLDLSDMAIQMYEAEADMVKAHGVHPDIMDEYERYDGELTGTERSCLALADELLALKDEKSHFTFVDIVVEQQPEEVLAKLQQIKAGKALAGANMQLAMKSDGSYYPVLDIKKKDLKLTGVGLRVWGWDDAKYIFTNAPGEKYDYPKDLLQYPSDEKQATRRFELQFSYAHPKTTVSESVMMTVNSNGGSDVSGQIFMSAYAETGYEGHGGSSVKDWTDDDVAAFGDLVAEIVGDEPESVGMWQDRKLQKVLDEAATPEVKDAIQQLIDESWHAQALYFLTRKWGNESIDALARDSSRADEALAAINDIRERWRQRFVGK